MGLVFTRIEVESRGTTHAALLVEPDGRVEISRNRFERMRAGEMDSRADREIVEACRDLPGIEAIVFRAHGNGPDDRWCFADDLSEDEAVELASLFIRAHLALFGELNRHGVVTMVGVEFDLREAAAYHEGFDQLAQQLQRELESSRDDERSAELRFGLWFVERQADWSVVPAREFVERELADRIRQASRQLERLRRHGQRVAGPA